MIPSTPGIFEMRAEVASEEEFIIVVGVCFVGKLEEIGKDIQANCILGIGLPDEINFVRFYATLHFKVKDAGANHSYTDNIVIFIIFSDCIIFKEII